MLMDQITELMGLMLPRMSVAQQLELLQLNSTRMNSLLDAHGIQIEMLVIMFGKEHAEKLLGKSLEQWYGGVSRARETYTEALNEALRVASQE